MEKMDQIMPNQETPDQETQNQEMPNQEMPNQEMTGQNRMDQNRMEQNRMGQEANEAPQRKKNRRPGFGGGLFLGVFATCLCIGIVVFCYCLATNQQLVVGRKSTGGTEILDSKTAAKIREIKGYMDKYYYEDFEIEELRNGLYTGLIGAIDDKYAAYYNKEANEDFKISTTGTYYGIGAGLVQDMDSMKVTVVRIYEGTPSEEAGLKKDDVILDVDGIDATSMELSLLVKNIRGAEGTTVQLNIYRPSSQENLTFTVERRNVEIPSVTSSMLEANIGYIQITEFQEKTASQFEQHLKKLEEQGMKSLMIDLRSNPGGLLDSVNKILDDILPEGLLVYTEDKFGKRKEYTSSGKTFMDYPMAVLIDENSASASEIFAGAIKDYGYGTLIGTTTFGKGIVQSIFSLEDGDSLKLTTAKYFTPKGNYIHGVGIEPDVELKYEFLGEKGEEYTIEKDNQVQKAIEILKDKSK